MIDYKELLKKYMDYVCTEEGTYFIGYLEPPTYSGLTKEEWKELKELRGPVQTFKGPLTRTPEYIREQKEWLLNELTSKSYT